MKYTNILFDLDNTLLDFSRSEKMAHRKTSEHFSLPWNEELYDTYSRINDVWWKKLERKECTQEEVYYKRYEDYFKEIGITFDAHIINKEYMKHLSNGRYLIHGGNSVLKTLSSIGCNIYLVSNGRVKTQLKRIKNQPFMRFVKDYCFSEEAGISKPSPQYFEFAQKKFNIDFDCNTLIVGDSLTSDIKGGNAIGIDTCWFNPNCEVNNKEKVTYEIHKLEELISIIKS